MPGSADQFHQADAKNQDGNNPECDGASKGETLISKYKPEQQHSTTTEIDQYRPGYS